MENVTQGRYASRVNRARILMNATAEMDAALPRWARRSNPVVKRELGHNWKRLLPDVTLISKVIGIQVIGLLILPLPLLMTMMMPVALVAFLAIPILVVLYGRIVLSAIHAAASAVVDARNNNTLDLIRMSKIPLRSILTGKVAASIWKRMDDTDMLMICVMLLALPLMSLRFFADLDALSFGSRLIVSLALIVLPIRLLMEPFMLGAVALAVGTQTGTRATATVITTGFMVFYYAMLIYPMSAGFIWVALLTDVLAPLVLPPLIAIGALMFAERAIENS